MPYSHIVDGKVLDVTCKNMRDKHYAVYLGDILIGQIFNMKFGWDVVSNYPQPLGVISGLKSKWKCYDLLIKMFELNRKEIK